MIKKLSLSCLLFVLFSVIAFLPPSYSQELQQTDQGEKLNQPVFNTISYDELVSLSKDSNIDSAMQSKIDYVLNNPAVDSTISKGEPVFLENSHIGKHLRMASWNIERGMRLDDILNIFNNPDKILEELNKTNPKAVAKVEDDIKDLKKADVLFLTEVDVGMPRTKYRNVPEDFAKGIGYNYAYGVEFFEIDPAHLGSEDCKWSEERLLFGDNPPAIIKDKYKGLHGSAILSRFPLKNVRVLRLPKYYDWYNDEKLRISSLESLKRRASSKFFREGVIREIRYGSRLALIADAQVPGLDTPITLVVTHLENRTAPKNRKKQLKLILESLHDVKNPVVIAGDFNTDVSDVSPKVKKEGKPHHRILRHCKFYNIPRHYVITPVMALPNMLRKHDDPTVKSIPIFSSNPERGLFNVLKRFEFADDNHFDFRSTPGKYIGKHGTLANSNERSRKGFVATFMFDRPLYIGKYKLDWLFVKAYSKKANDKDGSYKLAPHYGATLFDLNFAMEEPFSDHAPITVDLPLNEPPAMSKKQLKQLEEQEEKLEKTDEKLAKEGKLPEEELEKEEGFIENKNPVINDKEVVE